MFGLLEGLAALAAVVICLFALGVIIAADPLVGSVSIALLAFLLWRVLRRFLRWLDHAAAEYEAFRRSPRR